MRLKIISRSLDKIFVVFKAFSSDRGFATDRISKERIRVGFCIPNMINLQVCVNMRCKHHDVTSARPVSRGLHDIPHKAIYFLLHKSLKASFRPGYFE